MLGDSSRRRLLFIADPSKISSKRHEIDKIGRAAQDPELFTRVQKACLNRRAFLLVSDSYPNAFSIWLPQGDHVLLWVTYSDCKLDMHACLQQAVSMTTEIGLNKIVFYSVRKGFFRTAKKLGFTPSDSTWNGAQITQWAYTI
jgi:hypothetical protein